MTSQQILLILAGLAVGGTFVLNKKISHDNFRSTTYTALMTGLYSLFALPLFFFHFHISKNPYYWILVFVSSTIYGFSILFSFQAYKKTDVSIVSLIHKFSIVIVAIIGITFLHELYSVNKYFGLLLIFISSFIILFEKSKVAFDKGVQFALLMAVTTSVATVLDKQILNDFSPYTYAFVNNLLIWIIFSLRSPFSEQKKLFIANQKLILMSAALNMSSWTIFLVVLAQTNISQTIPVYKSLSLLVPVLFGILFLGEKGKLKQKIIGTLLGILGIIFIYR